MIQNLLMLFVAENVRHVTAAGVTLNQPPAIRASSGPRTDVDSPGPVNRLKFMATVVADAAGFAGLMAGFWIGLQILQAFLS